MLAKIKPSRNDFHTLARYLIDGDERPPNPKRVAWLFTHNLACEDDPMLAADYMAATAELSDRCRTPTFHMSVNWHESEHPSPEVMQEIARRVLDMSGLGEHQALVVGHADRPHKHFHIMANRVHPATGKAWSEWQSKLRFDRIMKQLADEYGFRYVPCHAVEPELTDTMTKGPDTAATYAARRGAPTDRTQWSRAASRDYGRQINDTISRATGWDDLDAAFAEDGLTLEAKGTGLVVGNAAAYSKFSALGLQSTAKELETRFGSRPAPPSRRHRAPRLTRWDRMRILLERDRLRSVFAQARDWHDLATRLGGYGLTLTRFGNGWRITDGASFTSLSSLGWSAARLEKLFAAKASSTRDDRKPLPRRSRSRPLRLPTPGRGTPPSRRRRPPIHKVRAWAARNVFAVDAVAIARVMGSKADLRRAVNEATGARKARLAHAPLMAQLMEEVKQLLKASTSLAPTKRRQPPKPARTRSTGKPRPRYRGRR